MPAANMAMDATGLFELFYSSSSFSLSLIYTHKKKVLIFTLKPKLKNVKRKGKIIHQ